MFTRSDPTQRRPQSISTYRIWPKMWSCTNTIIHVISNCWTYLRWCNSYFGRERSSSHCHRYEIRRSMRRLRVSSINQSTWRKIWVRIDSKLDFRLFFYWSVSNERFIACNLFVVVELTALVSTGCGILCVSWMFTLKSVRYLILRKGGNTVSFVTYGPFGTNRILDVPLRCVTALQSRGAVASYLPLKIKGRTIYYILDKKGEYTNPEIFDHVINVRRRFWIDRNQLEMRNWTAFIFKCGWCGKKLTINLIVFELESL